MLRFLSSSLAIAVALHVALPTGHADGSRGRSGTSARSSRATRAMRGLALRFAGRERRPALATAMRQDAEAERDARRTEAELAEANVYTAEDVARVNEATWGPRLRELEETRRFAEEKIDAIGRGYGTREELRVQRRILRETADEHRELTYLLTGWRAKRWNFRLPYLLGGWVLSAESTWAVLADSPLQHAALAVITLGGVGAITALSRENRTELRPGSLLQARADLENAGIRLREAELALSLAQSRENAALLARE